MFTDADTKKVDQINFGAIPKFGRGWVINKNGQVVDNKNLLVMLGIIPNRIMVPNQVRKS